MIRINLLPVRALKKQKSTRQMISILSLAVGGVILINRLSFGLPRY